MFSKFILIKIFSYLGLNDLKSCSLVSKEFLSRFQDDFLWKIISGRICPEKSMSRSEFKNYLNITEAAKYNSSMDSKNIFLTNIKKIPIFIKFTNIERLRLDNAGLKKITIYNANLKYLLLTNNKIKKIPKNIFQMKSLEILDLSNNLLTKIPEVIKKMSLKKLVITGNKIKKIPEIPSLEILVAHKSIETLPDLSKMPKLVSMIIDRHLLVKEHENIKNFAYMREIAIDVCEISFKKLMPDELSIYQTVNPYYNKEVDENYEIAANKPDRSTIY